MSPQRTGGIFRIIDASSLALFLVLIVTLAVRLRPCLAGHSRTLLVVVGIAAYATADLVSGTVHWLADTWGTPATPVVGRLLIWPFREHHVDPLAITRHDFVEVNGANCLVAVPVAALAHVLLSVPGIPARAIVSAFVGIFLCGIFATNQFHKWAHLEESPRPVRWLQRCRLVLPAAHHRLHHVAPHDRSYCITTGWLNVPLDRLRVFARLEAAITALTGIRPRADGSADASRRVSGVPRGRAAASLRPRGSTAVRRVT